VNAISVGLLTFVTRESVNPLGTAAEAEGPSIQDEPIITLMATSMVKINRR
jgi:hypothetical protein